MKIEKLRKNHKKEIIIGTILTVVIGGALTYKLTHSKYRVTQSIDLGSGVINYKVPDFKIMAMYKNDGSGDVSIDSMPTSGYVINEEKTYCKTSSGSQVKGKIKTENGKHYISGLNKGDKCYLYFDKQILGADQILANITPKTTAPDFSQVATTDEGVYSTTDGMYGGTTYYWRGAATTNHVIFANKCWRIVRINGDKTIRLIYNEEVQSGNTCKGNGENSDAVVIGFTNSERIYSTSDGKYNNSSYVGWTYILNSQRPPNTTSGTQSNAKVQTDNWYNNNIANNTAYSTKVADGKFCNDRNGSWDKGSTVFYYAGYTRLYTGYSPTYSCDTSDVYTLKVGAIIVDEVAFAGGKRGTENLSYYMYAGRNYWTMSPCYWDGNARVFAVVSSGFLNPEVVHSGHGFRPVINLKVDVAFSSGDGTQNNPYTVS